MGNVGSVRGNHPEGLTTLERDATRFQEAILFKPELLARVALENGDHGFGRPSGPSGSKRRSEAGGGSVEAPWDERKDDLVECDPEALTAATAVAAHAQCSIVRSLDDPLSLISDVSDLAVWVTAVGDSDSLTWNEIFRRRDRVMVLFFSRMRRQLIAAQAAEHDER